MSWSLGLVGLARIHILYVTDNLFEVNHFPIHCIQVGWLHYALFFPNHWILDRFYRVFCCRHGRLWLLGFLFYSLSVGAFLLRHSVFWVWVSHLRVSIQVFLVLMQGHGKILLVLWVWQYRILTTFFMSESSIWCVVFSDSTNAFCAWEFPMGFQAWITRLDTPPDTNL